MTSPFRAHEARKAVVDGIAAGLEARSRRISLLRLASVVVALAGAFAAATGRSGAPAGAAIGLGVVAFVALVVAHGRVIRAKERALHAARFHARAMARIAGRAADDPSRGERFLVADHPYLVDLDLFGRASLFQLVDTTTTRAGESTLAGWLSAPAPLDEARARQAAVRELAGKAAFREELAVEGALLAEKRPDPEPLLAWAEGERALPASAALRALAWLAPATWIGLAVLGSFGLAPASAWSIAAMATYAAGTLLAGRTSAAVDAALAVEGSLAAWRDLLARVERERFDAPRLAAIEARLAGAAEEVRRLATVASFVEARRNEVFRLILGPTLLWDVHGALALEAWKARSGGRVRAWLDALGEVEALASFGGWAADRPEHVFPELVEAPRFEATALGHPLLPADRCVRNDVAVPGPGHALLVTGSNMSGKSTMLRALGLNTVLAMAGAPVCAERLVVGPFDVRTSMRMSDSLEQGTSHFYAELRRLKLVLDGIGGERTVLFLLDEILHGTNSRERRIGAGAVLARLLAAGAMGAVSTHDLGLVDLGPALDAHLVRVHFEEQVDGERMTFDYRLRPGVVRSSNALRLMRSLGMDVDLPES